MKYSLCTISFRHELVSFLDLIDFAADTGFKGIELWGVHARSDWFSQGDNLRLSQRKLQELNIDIMMLSDYLNIAVSDEEFKRHTTRKCEDLIRRAALFGAQKIRIFAGNVSSAEASDQFWSKAIVQLQEIAAMLDAHGLELVLETHPNTLTDTLPSTLRVLEELNRPNIKINLDFLHLWEKGTSPASAYSSLSPLIAHFHLKNVRSMEDVPVFGASNVYSPSGSREGMVPLMDGAMDYSEIVELLHLEPNPYYASLEWFGEQPFTNMKKDFLWLKAREEAIHHLQF